MNLEYIKRSPVDIVSVNDGVSTFIGASQTGSLEKEMYTLQNANNSGPKL